MRHTSLKSSLVTHCYCTLVKNHWKMSHSVILCRRPAGSCHCKSKKSQMRLFLPSVLCFLSELTQFSKLLFASKMMPSGLITYSFIFCSNTTSNPNAKENLGGFVDTIGEATLDYPASIMFISCARFSDLYLRISNNRSTGINY